MATSVRAAFLAALDPPDRATVERVADAVESASGPLDVAMKWNRLTYAVGGDFHHWICGIGVTKRGAVLQFHFGRLIDDPDGRLATGQSKFLAKLEFADPSSVDPAIVAAFVREAVELLPFFRANWKAIQAGTVTPP